MVTVTLVNQKGGVGKTTSSVSLAHGLALKNYNVLLVDADAQGQCAAALAKEQEDGLYRLLVDRLPLRDVVRTTGRDGLWLLPGSKRSKTAEGLMLIERQPINTLRDILSETVDGSRLHYVVIDTAPGAGGLQENAMYAADLLIIPTAVDHLSLEGVAQVMQTERALGRPLPEMRILPTFYDSVTNESRVNLEQLRRAFSESVLTPIHRAVVLRECPALGKTIFEHQPDGRAAEEYARLVWEVIRATAS